MLHEPANSNAEAVTVQRDSCDVALGILSDGWWREYNLAPDDALELARMLKEQADAITLASEAS